MRQVTAYETEDGKVFDSESDAAEHEARTALRDIVEGFSFPERSPSDAELCGMVQNILRHGYYIHRVLAEALKYIPVPAEEDDS